MKCDSVLDLLSASIDGELSEEEKVCVEQHVETCVMCREVLEVYRDIQKNIDVVNHTSLPRGFHDELMDKIKLETKGEVIPLKVPRKNRYKWMGYIASVAAMFIGAMIVIMPDAKNEEASSPTPQPVAVDEASPMARRRAEEPISVSMGTAKPETNAEVSDAATDSVATPQVAVNASPVQNQINTEVEKMQATTALMTEVVALEVNVESIKACIEALEAWGSARGITLAHEEDGETMIVELQPLSDVEALKEHLKTIETVQEIKQVTEYDNEIVTIKLYTE